MNKMILRAYSRDKTGEKAIINESEFKDFAEIFKKVNQDLTALWKGDLKFPFILTIESEEATAKNSQANKLKSIIGELPSDMSYSEFVK